MQPPFTGANHVASFRVLADATTHSRVPVKIWTVSHVSKDKWKTWRHLVQHGRGQRRRWSADHKRPGEALARVKTSSRSSLAIPQKSRDVA